MTYEIKFSKSVFKFLEKTDKSVLLRFNDVLDLLRKNSYCDKLDIKKIKGKKNHYRLRIWKYRFLYEVRKDKILVYLYYVDSRWDVY